MYHFERVEALAPAGWTEAFARVEWVEALVLVEMTAQVVPVLRQALSIGLPTQECHM